ncbi:conserved domain protein [Streptococcus infantis SK970]|nr:conserved domain protein [Streptococcus infantis SK970]
MFGHSVDPLDKEIFQNCFTLASGFFYGYRFIFTYYNESAKRSIVKNLAIILGKDKLVELTGNGNVVFIKSDDVDGMREVLLD